jgi:hypothetical protein
LEALVARFYWVALRWCAGGFGVARGKPAVTTMTFEPRVPLCPVATKEKLAQASPTTVRPWTDIQDRKDGRTRQQTFENSNVHRWERRYLDVWHVCPVFETIQRSSLLASMEFEQETVGEIVYNVLRGIRRSVICRYSPLWM